MSNVLTLASTVLCGTAAPLLHGGKVVTVSLAKLTVNSSSVLTQTSIAPQLVDLGLNKCQTPVDNSGHKPCTSVNSVSGGMSTKLTVNGQPVMLETVAGKGVTDGNPSGTLAATANQSKLTAA
jgi:hypothetical protein